MSIPTFKVLDELKYVLSELIGLPHELEMVYPDCARYNLLSPNGYHLGFVEMTIDADDPNNKQLYMFGSTSGAWNADDFTRLRKKAYAAMEQFFHEDNNDRTWVVSGPGHRRRNKTT